MAELAALVDHEALPLRQQALVHVCEKQGHEGILLQLIILFLQLLLLAVLGGTSAMFKLDDSGEVLLQDDRGDQLNGLAQHLVVLLLGPGLRRLIQEALQKLSEFLYEGELLAFRGGLDAVVVEEFEFGPDENCALVEAHIGFEEANRVHLLKTGAVGARLALLVEAAEIGVGGHSLLPFALRVHLLPDHCLVLGLHLVQIVRLQVVHQDAEAAHDFCLLLDLGRLAALQVHLRANPLDLLRVDLDAPAVVALARRGQTQRLVAHLIGGSALLRCDDRLGALVEVQVPRVVDLLESALF